METHPFAHLSDLRSGGVVCFGGNEKFLCVVISRLLYNLEAFCDNGLCKHVLVFVMVIWDYDFYYFHGTQFHISSASK